ncbi:MAG: alpha/beta fold hydrolase [Anaerolineales bacterium]|nr:alpha/beta fold hydrolase [Anaerolineales bacterium]
MTRLRAFALFSLLACLAACNLPLGAAGSLPAPEVALATLGSTEVVQPSATATLVPSPTPTPPPHPLSIEYLRAQEFPATELVIEQTLPNGANYYRYIASYFSEGLKQYGLLTVPFGQTPESGWPVIVFNHGYIAPQAYRTTERYVNYVDGFARSGYIVFRPDYRGHDRSEGQAGGAYGRPDYVIDVLNAVAALKAYPDADPNRLGMWGHSMGGYITLRAMLADADIKAGVIWAGVVAAYADMVHVDGRPRFGTRGLLEAYGPPEANPEFWASISANSYLAELPGPLQLHHGTADSSVPAGFSVQLAVQVRQAGGVAELYEYDGDDHNISRFFTSAMLRSIEFFDRHVKGSG